MGLSESIANADPHVAVITRIGRGSQPDLAELFDTTSERVFALVRYMIGDQAAAEAVLLAVYLQVWRQAAHYDPRYERPLPWLLRLARQQALAYLRTTGCPPVQIVAPVRASAVLESLAAEQVQVIEMAYYGGLTYHKIAEALQLSPNIIRDRIGVALQGLRQKLTVSNCQAPL